MDINDIHPPDDYSHRFFIWHEWLQANGPLTSENVFDYFTTSMFYDKQSNNQVLRMQTMHTGMPLVNEAEELRRFTGVEFALVHAQVTQTQTFFIIQKRERLSPDEVRPLAAYFIMNSRIYQSPDVYTVLSNRLLTSLYSLQSSLDSLRKHRPEYTPRTGFVWPITDPGMSEDSKKKDDGEVATPQIEGATTSALPKRSDAPRRQKNNILLVNAMRATAVHSKVSFTPNSLPSNAEILAEATPASSTNIRLSITPAPAAPKDSTPAKGPGPPPEPVKGIPGAGKKKKKRTSLAAPPAAPT